MCRASLVLPEQCVLSNTVAQYWESYCVQAPAIAIMFILLAAVVFWQNCCNRRYPNAAGFGQERTLSCVLRLSACPSAIRLLAMNAWPPFGGEEMCHNLGYI